LDGENIKLHKDLSKNTYNLIDSERDAELILDFDHGTSSFKYKGKIYEKENLKKENSLSPVQEIVFIKLVILSQQIFGSSSQQTESYGKWNEIEHSNVENATKSCYRYYLSFGWTRSEAEYKAEQDINAFLSAYPTCFQIGGIDVTCGLSLAPCVATVTFSCTGAICDAGIVTE